MGGCARPSLPRCVVVHEVCIGTVEQWMCGESWLAIKDLKPTIPSSQARAFSVNFNVRLLLSLFMVYVLCASLYSLYMYYIVHNQTLHLLSLFSPAILSFTVSLLFFLVLHVVFLYTNFPCTCLCPR